MYKHVAKQRKLTDSNKEARLSDEEASDDSSSDDAGSDSEANDSDSAFGDEEEDGIILPATGASDDEEDAEDEVELKEPPKGFPSALEALDNPIAEPDSVEGAAEGEEIQPVCVVCPSKALKRGKMLEIHLASKDHKRRLTRFTAHVKADDFPESSLPLDARAICAQLDALVFKRLSEQTLHGGPSTGKQTKPETKKELSAEDQEKLAGALERQSRRAALRDEKKLKHLERRNNKKEKIQRLKAKRDQEKAAKEGASKGSDGPAGESKKSLKRKANAAKAAAEAAAPPAGDAPAKDDAPIVKKERKPKQKKEQPLEVVPSAEVAPSPAPSNKRKAKAPKPVAA